MHKIKIVFIVLSLAAAAVPVMAEDAMWTWIYGSGNCNQSGTSDVPSGREQSSFWIDTQENLWLFGGYGIGINYLNTGSMNDLWKFDGTGWTWEKGSSGLNAAGVYGTKGTGNSNNIPGARSSSASWTNSSDYFYLFGGDGYDANGSLGLLNDLWRYRISSNTWTWMSGSNLISQYGTYGTRGVASSNNTPGARGWSATCIDSNGILWLFGGYGYGSSGLAGVLNDLWKYSGSKWTWVSGSTNISQKGVYGTEGAANADNWPGARYGSVLWADTKSNLWLYGGRGYDNKSTGGYLSDLWKFDVNNNEWTWISGSSRINSHKAGIYGTQGEPNAQNVPGDRDLFAAWRDNYGYLWLFGGEGYDKNGNYGLLNDLWNFNGSVWEWVSGSQTKSHAGIYGTRGQADSNNTPGARVYCSSVMDPNGNLWLFGGIGYDASGNDGNMNDLWKFGSIIPDGVKLRVFCEANEITSEQVDPVIIGTVPFKIAGPSKTFTIRNNGSQTLVLLSELAGPTHFIITQPEESTLAPGEDTTFTVTLDSNEIGVFNETISFDNNDIDNKPFSFNVKGTVLPWKFGYIDGSTKSTKFTAPDACGMPVTFGLTGSGYGEIIGDSNFNQVNLYDTSEKSSLTISSKTVTSVGDINSNGPLKTIAAKTANLRGDILVKGSLASLIIKDMNNANEHTITIGSSSNLKSTASFTFGRVAELSLISAMPIKAISATEWLGGEINVPSISTIKTSADKKHGAAGDMNVNAAIAGTIGSITTAGSLSGQWNCMSIKSISALNVISANLYLDQEPNAKILALGKLTVKNHITDSQIISDGNIGTISTGAMINSVCFAGIKNSVSGLPDSADDINVPVSIKSITVKGVKGEPNCFINSDIAAANIINANLNYPQTDNNDVSFGLFAGFIKSLKIKNAAGTTSLKNLDSPSDNNDFDDFKIRLY